MKIKLLVVMVLATSTLHAMDKETRSQLHEFLYHVGFVGKDGKLSDQTIQNFKCGRDLHKIAKKFVTKEQLILLSPLLNAFLKHEKRPQEAFDKYISHFNIKKEQFRFSIKIKESYSRYKTPLFETITDFMSKEETEELLALMTMNRAAMLDTLKVVKEILEDSLLFFPGTLVSLSIKERHPSRPAPSKSESGTALKGFYRRSLSPNSLRHIKLPSSNNSMHHTGHISITKTASPTSTPATPVIPVIPSIIEHIVTIHIPNAYPRVSKELFGKLTTGQAQYEDIDSHSRTFYVQHNESERDVTF